MNWFAVIWAAIAFMAVLHFTYLRQRGEIERRIERWLFPVAWISRAMLGHALVRIGADKLTAKPQLYFMQSGGLALAFVIPALFISQTRQGVSLRQTTFDSAAFLAAYLAMGAVFWVMG